MYAWRFSKLFGIASLLLMGCGTAPKRAPNLCEIVGLPHYTEPTLECTQSNGEELLLTPKEAEGFFCGSSLDFKRDLTK